MDDLLNNSLIDVAGDAVSASASIDDDGDVIDLSACDGVLFCTQITDSAAGGVAKLRIEAGDATDELSDISGSEVSATCTTADDLNGLLLVSQYHSGNKRYAAAHRLSSTAAIAFGPVIAIRYGVHKAPVTQGDTIADSASVVG